MSMYLQWPVVHIVLQLNFEWKLSAKEKNVFKSIFFILNGKNLELSGISWAIFCYNYKAAVCHLEHYG